MKKIKTLLSRLTIRFAYNELVDELERESLKEVEGMEYEPTNEPVEPSDAYLEGYQDGLKEAGIVE